jgi:hypothetical protein
VRYQYYQGNWNFLPNFATETVLASGTQDSVTLENAQQANRFGFVFSAYIVPPVSGLFIFNLTSDDGSALFINGTRVINNDGVKAATSVLGNYTMVVNTLYSVSIQYFQRDGDKVLILTCGIQGGPIADIPSNLLLCDPRKCSHSDTLHILD